MLLVTACALMFLLQIPRDAAPGRDAPLAPRGTAVIRGKVTALDTGQALRRSLVTLFGGPSPARRETHDKTSVRSTPVRSINRTIPTDGEGTFEFAALPAGTYHIRVSGGPHRTHYLAVAFGARGPQEAGKPIELADGQIVQANVALPRGGAITGRVIDEFGEPVSRVGVTPARVTAGTSFERIFLNVETDDLGRFRLFGLEPGEYVVSAEARNQGGPPVEGTNEGFAPTYYPSALTDREGGRVRVAFGQDSPDIEIALVRTRTFRITGTVVDSQGAILTRAHMSLTRATRSGSGFSSTGVSFDQSGKFTMRNVLPGQYALVVRPVFGDPFDAPAEQPKPRREFALLPITVDADIEDLVILTRPGTSVAGRVVFAEGPPHPPPSGMRVTTEPFEAAMTFSNPMKTVDGNLQFTLTDMFGAHYVRAHGFPRGYVVKAVMLGATDITDTGVEFKPEHSGHLQIVVTGRTSTLEGTVTDDRDEPASGVSLLILPEEKTSWRMGSPRMRVAGSTDGKFRLEGVLAGRYHIVAIPRDRLRFSRDLGPEAFEPFLKDATTVVIAENETRTVDLRVARE